MYDSIISHYEKHKENILNRKQEFLEFRDMPVSWFLSDGKMQLNEVTADTDIRLFEELCFCLMTANTSAVMGMKGVDAIRPIVMDADIEGIRQALKDAGYRYPNVRAGFIIEARDKLQKYYGMKLKDLLDSFDSNKDAREFLAENVKGLGYKEASHYLRNIGIFGLAILDKHILRTMNEYGIIDKVPKSLNRKNYLEHEEKFKEFSYHVGIDMDTLDIVLWSMKNGNIMK